MDRRNSINDLSVPVPTASITSATPSAAGGTSRAALAAWLTNGRVARGLTREHVARVTRIQLRTLERLEEGRFDELPADVFVRGFIRNYARCVGLSIEDALLRYGACGFAAAPVASPQAHALLESMAPLHAPASRTSSVIAVPSVPREPTLLAPQAASSAPSMPAAPAVAEAAEPAPAPAASAASASKLRRVRDAKGRFLRKSEISAQIEAVSVDAIADDELEVEITVADFVAAADELLGEVLAQELEPSNESRAEPKFAAAAQPVAASVTADVRPVVTVRPEPAATKAGPQPVTHKASPTLVIDDDDPDAAEREREERAQREKEGGWRSFLPPALLDQDRGRQGGLTLAVIILLIVATLTLSYLMRRPSSTGEGVTQSTRAIPAGLA